MISPINPSFMGQMLMERFLVVEHLAIGGFSQIFLTIDTEQPTQPDCLVKVLDQSLNPDLDFAVLKQFFDAEAHALGRLNGQRLPRPDRSPVNVPELLLYCRDRQLIYLVQEFVEGQRFEDWVATQPFKSIEAAQNSLWSLLSTVQQLHEQQIIHCDIKPSNIIRRGNGALMLIDFGACYLGDQTNYLAKSLRQLALGTPGYMPEEQAAGLPQPSSDLYALGMVMIQALTQVPPKQLERAANGQEWQWQQHLRQNSKNATLIEILTRMTRINASQRYQTASEVLNDLRPLMPLEALYPEALADSTAVPRGRSLITPWQSDEPTRCRIDRRVVPA